MQIVTTAYGRKDTRRYKIALAALAAVGAIAFVLLRLLPDTAAALLSPIAAGLATVCFFVALYTLVLSRRFVSSLSSFVRPIVLAWVYPVYFAAQNMAFWLCSRTGAEYTSQGTLVLDMVKGVSAVALALAVAPLAAAAVITSVMHYRAASQTHSIYVSMLPLALALIGSLVSGTLCFSGGILPLLTGV